MEENNKPEVAQEQPQVDDKVEKLKIKKKPSMKKFSNDPDGTVKLDLSKKPKPEENEKPEAQKEWPKVEKWINKKFKEIKLNKIKDDQQMLKVLSKTAKGMKV